MYLDRRIYIERRDRVVYAKEISKNLIIRIWITSS